MKDPYKCSVCGTTSCREWIEAYDADSGTEAFQVVVCSHCRSGSLRPLPSDAELERYYAPSYYGEGRTKFGCLFQWLFDYATVLRARRIRRKAGTGRLRALDIGCGRGKLISELGKLGVDAVGIERGSAPQLVDHDRSQIHYGELAECGFTDASFDVVIIWHVLEHLRDPECILKEARRLLRQGGLLIVAVPNSASWQAGFFGRQWLHLDLPRHLHFFGQDGLCTMLGRLGYSVSARSTIDPVQSVFGFIQSSLNVVPRAPPNRLYQLMRSAQSPALIAELLFWGVAAVFLLLPALLEFACSAVRGAGACCVVYARRA